MFKNAIVAALFVLAGVSANSLVRPANPESELAAIQPIPIQVSEFPTAIAPEIEVEAEEPDVTSIIRPLPVAVNPEVIVPEVEVVPVEPEVTEIIRPLPVEVSPEVISPEIEVLPAVPEAEVCQTEEEAPEVAEIPELEIVVPEAPQVKPQPIVPEVPEIEVILPEEPEVEACAESEAEVENPLVRPLPVEENPSAIAPEIAVPVGLLPNIIYRN